MTVFFTRPGEFSDELQQAARRPEGVVDGVLRLTARRPPAGGPAEFVGTFAIRTLLAGVATVETVYELRCGWEEQDGAPADREAARVWRALAETAKSLGLKVSGGAFSAAG